MSYKPILIKCVFMVPTAQRPAENKTSFLRCRQCERTEFLHSHTQRADLSFYREKVAFPMTFYWIIKAIFISQPSTGFSCSPFWSLCLLGLCLASSHQVKPRTFFFFLHAGVLVLDRLALAACRPGNALDHSG